MFENKSIGVFLVLVAVVGMVISQLTIKNVFNQYGTIPLSYADFINYLYKLLLYWKAWFAGITLIVSAVIWYVALSRLPLSYAFPIAAISYPLILILSYLYLGEQITFQKLMGNALIVTGVLIIGFANSS